MELRRVTDREALCRTAAGLFVRLARRAVAERGRFVVALAGGSTPREVYRRLAASFLREQVPWAKIEFFWGDERPVPPDHPDSNYRMAWEAFLSSAPVAPEQIHRMRAECADLEGAARGYEQEMRDVLGLSQGAAAPRFDLILLGMGADGHTASLFPDADAPSITDRWVVESHGPGSGRRLTLTLPLLNRARCVCFLVTGRTKAKMLAAVMEGPKAPERLPSQAVAPNEGRLIWMIDRAAAEDLRGTSADEPRLAPSILAADFARLGEQVRAVHEAGADRIHLDVMDGHFVPNLSIGPAVVRATRGATHLPLETHLMVACPEDFVQPFAEAGSDSIIFHCEATSNPGELIERIRDLGMGVGISLRPGTPTETVEDLIGAVDLVLVMTVEPGFGGQAFLAESLPRIERLRKVIEQVNPVCELEVDGGIDARTAPQARMVGAGVFVAGSAIFSSAASVADSMTSLRRSLVGNRRPD